MQPSRCMACPPLVMIRVPRLPPFDLTFRSHPDILSVSFASFLALLSSCFLRASASFTTFAASATLFVAACSAFFVWAALFSSCCLAFAAAFAAASSSFRTAEFYCALISSISSRPSKGSSLNM
jgi:hypothetical protein